MLFLGGSYVLQTGDRMATAHGLQNLGVMQKTSQDSGGSSPGSQRRGRSNHWEGLDSEDPVPAAYCWAHPPPECPQLCLFLHPQAVTLGSL